MILMNGFYWYNVNLTYFILENRSCLELVSYVNFDFKNEISHSLSNKQIDNLQFTF